MDSHSVRNIGWPSILITVLLLVCAFAIPIFGPLRSSGARVVLAIAILIIGAGLAFLVESRGRS